MPSNLITAGVTNKVGWAFGLGLERIAMQVYGIPDIRLFWSNDSGFLSQFETAKPDSKIQFKVSFLLHNSLPLIIYIIIVVATGLILLFPLNLAGLTFPIY